MSLGTASERVVVVPDEPIQYIKTSDTKILYYRHIRPTLLLAMQGRQKAETIAIL